MASGCSLGDCPVCGYPVWEDEWVMNGNSIIHDRCLKQYIKDTTHISEPQFVRLTEASEIRKTLKSLKIELNSMVDFFEERIQDLEELPTEYSMVITFVGQHGIPPNYTDLQAAIAEIIPAHLAVSYLLRYLLWSELDAKNLTWDELDVKSLAWNEFELGGWIDA